MKSKLFPARIPCYQAVFRKVWILYKFGFVGKSKLLDFPTLLVFWSLVRNSVVLAVYLLFSVACFFTAHEHYLAARMKRGKSIVDVICTLPMVLPPTVVGFFLLLLFGKNSMLGAWLMAHGIPVVFSQTGMVIASAVVSFPLLYRTARGAFEQMDETLVYAAQTLGLGSGTIFFRIVCPNCLPGILAGVILAFTRAMGEFGATIMLAGNIPGKTQTAAIAIYTAMQNGNRELAFQWGMLIIGMSVFFIVLMNVITGRKGGRTWH